MPTLYQMAMKWWEEKKFYDPLGVRSGAVLTIDTLDYKEFIFKVADVVEYKRTQEIEGREPYVTTWTDYVLKYNGKFGGYAKYEATPADMIQLRCHPNTPEKVLLLKLDGEEQYSQELEDATKTGSFQIWYEGKLLAEYHRCTDGVRDPYQMERRSLSDNAVNIALCDYVRTAKDEAGNDFDEYYFVERDVDTGYFSMYKGTEVSSERIHAY